MPAASIVMEYIPPHSPDLNCMEELWKDMKRHKVNYWFDDIDENVWIGP